MEYPISAVSPNIINALVKKAKSVPKGCFVEVGVYKGGTASRLTEIAEQEKRKIFLYDTFEGIPYKDELDSHPVGDFGDSDYETVKNNLTYAKVVKGIFPDSAVKMPKIAFVHIDVDQYKSYKDCIEYLSPMMVKGGVMWFDDYTLVGARTAILEKFRAEQLVPAPCGHDIYYVVF